MEYHLDAYDYSYTHLTCSITGYFQDPYFQYLGYRYLLIYANNPFVGIYMTLDILKFVPGVTEIDTNLPSLYVAGNTL